MFPCFDAHSHLPDGGSRPSDHLRVVCGTGPSDWGAVLAHAAGDARVIPMLGLHPWCLDEAPVDWAERLEDLLRLHPMGARAGVGECGLDYARKRADRAGQEEAFRAQLRLARALGRPVAIHAVQAWGRLLDLLREEGVPPAGALVHAFGGSPETAQALAARGVFLSFSGDLLRAGHGAARASLAVVPEEALLLETDGSADLAAVIGVAAALRDTRAEDLAVRTWENGRRCFKEVLA